MFRLLTFTLYFVQFSISILAAKLWAYLTESTFNSVINWIVFIFLVLYFTPKCVAWLMWNFDIKNEIKKHYEL